MRICKKCGAVLDAGERCTCGGSETKGVFRSRKKEPKPKSRLALETERLVQKAREEYLRGF